MSIAAFVTLGLLAFAPVARATVGDGGQPEELGLVRWQRDLDRALSQSKEKKLPVLALFQEIPGCATCRRFGAEPLSNPLLVEAMETSFIPVAIYNNRPGKDAEFLQRFREPSYNNPVMRFLDAEGRDVVPRRDGVWSTHGIAERMIAALKAAKIAVPGYLALAAEESAAVDAQSAVFAMACYWQGEARLGALKGVVGTRPGWLEGREVVEVRFDPERTSFRDLVRAVLDGGCADQVFARDDAQMKEAQTVKGLRVERSSGAVRDVGEGERKYYLKQSKYRGLALTPLQAQRVNSALGLGQDPLQWLSPRQAASLADAAGRARDTR